MLSYVMVLQPTQQCQSHFFMSRSSGRHIAAFQSTSVNFRHQACPIPGGKRLRNGQDRTFAGLIATFGHNRGMFCRL
jgi:hypothetical protein